MSEAIHLEQITQTLFLYVSASHRFGTDAFLLADFACSRKKGETVCDLGTGCGIIPMLLLREEETAPGRIYGIELQEDAIELLTRTVEHCGLAQRIVPVHGDLRAPALPAAFFDLVCSNPPYKKAESGLLSRKRSDQIARHETACTLLQLCQAAGRLLRYGGRFCVCQRPERLPDIFSDMRKAGIEPKRLRFVHQRPGRQPWLVLVEGRRGGKPHLRVEPPLIVERENGGFSQEMLRIYGKD